MRALLRPLANGLRVAARRTNKRTGRRLAAIANVLDRPIDLSDAYTDHLGYAIAGMLNRGNLYCFDHALRHLPPEGPIVEIGSFCGLSAAALTYYKRRLGITRPLVTCDSWAFEQAMAGDPPVTRAAYAAFVRASFRHAMEAFAAWDRPHAIHCTADAFFDAWRRGAILDDVFGRPTRLGGPIAFAYVDGNHGYEFAKRDWQNVREFLAPGGLLLFDDSYDGSGWGVARLMPEVLADGAYELVARNPNYYFRRRASGPGGASSDAK